MVGNYYILNCEEFVFNVHHDVMHNMSNDYIDEVWLMPMYSHAKEYIEFLTNKPVKISPYVWDGEIINKYISWGAGPRSSQYLIVAAKCNAAINGKFSPDIEDVKAVAEPILRHRLVRNYIAEADGFKVEKIINEIL